MNCPNCGTTLMDGAAFCSNCGARLQAQPAAQTVRAAQPANAPANPGYAQPAYQQPYQPQPYQQPYQQPTAQGTVGAKSKVAAGLLGIFLGALGIHKFYLGYTKAGVIMLLVSLLTLGIGAVVMEIIGLIEGIIYLTKDDMQFYQIYELGEKQWF